MSKNFDNWKMIGRGAFGDVYLSERKQNHQSVVIKKIFIDQLENGQEECKAIENEVKCHAQFKHPNILEYYESFVEDNTAFIVMEYAQGGTLYDYIKLKKEKNLSLEENDVLSFFCQLAAGVQQIHKRNILHRDLKSHNVLLDRTQKVVKIGDFGISKLLESKTKALTVVGTPCYFSPELCRQKPYSKKSDIWALGCLLYEILTLHRAFEAENHLALSKKIIRGKVEPISPTYSQDIRELVRSMLQINPDVRPDINQIISSPIVLSPLLRIFSDFGRIVPVS